MKQRLPILETNPATLSVAFGPKTTGTMTLFKEDETTALVDTVDFSLAGSDLTPDAQGLIEIDMLIGQVVTVKDGATIIYKAPLEGDQGRIEFTLANGDIARGYNIINNALNDNIITVANGFAWAEVFFNSGASGTKEVRVYMLKETATLGTELLDTDDTNRVQHEEISIAGTYSKAYESRTTGNLDVTLEGWDSVGGSNTIHILRLFQSNSDNEMRYDSRTIDSPAGPKSEAARPHVFEVEGVERVRIASDKTTLIGDIVNVTRTFTTVALANAGGLPVGTRYKLSVGTDDVKSIVRETF